MDIIYTLIGMLIWLFIVLVLLALEEHLIKKCKDTISKNAVTALYSCAKVSLSIILAILPIIAILILIELIYSCLLGAIFG